MARKRDIGWRIDYIVVNEELKDKVTSCSIKSEIEGSDHCPVEVIFTFELAEN